MPPEILNTTQLTRTRNFFFKSKQQIRTLILPLSHQNFPKFSLWMFQKYLWMFQKYCQNFFIKQRKWVFICYIRVINDFFYFFSISKFDKVSGTKEVSLISRYEVGIDKTSMGQYEAGRTCTHTHVPNIRPIPFFLFFFFEAFYTHIHTH